MVSGRSIRVSKSTYEDIIVMKGLAESRLRRPVSIAETVEAAVIAAMENERMASKRSPQSGQ